jgi:hypothetical protein
MCEKCWDLEKFSRVDGEGEKVMRGEVSEELTTVKM